MIDEYIVLSIATSNKESLLRLIEETTVDHFTHDLTRTIYTAAKKIHEEGGRVDGTSIHSTLVDMGKDSVYAEFNKHCVGHNSMHFAPTIKKIKNNYSTRNLYKLALDIRDGILSKSLDLEAIQTMIKESSKYIDIPESEIIDMAKFSGDDIENIFEKSNYQKTGLKELDDLIFGIFDTQLTIIAARPALGKTSLALQIAIHLQDSLFFSLEMNKRELYARMLSMKAKVQSWLIEAGKLTKDEKKRVVEANMNYHNTLKLSVVDSVTNINRILTIAERHISRGKCRSVFIDYLQLCSGGAGENQNLRIADISRKCKKFALEHKTPVILLSQLNREIEKTKRKPQLSDLRDSGAIEQDADRVIFLHEEDGAHELIIAKNRKGAAGKSVDVKFEKQFTLFGCDDLREEYIQVAF